MLAESKRLLAKMDKEYYRNRRKIFDFSFYADFSNDTLEELETLGYIKRLYDIVGSIELTHNIVVSSEELINRRENESNDKPAQDGKKKEKRPKNRFNAGKDIKNVLLGAIASIIAGLVLYYWPGIVDFFKGFFQ